MTLTGCPLCGHENAPSAKFCSECGANLAQPSQGARTERKVLTVLFADLVGFTAQAERLDPEDVQAILRPYHERLRSELERFGGTVEKFIGDAVMALFGAPTAHEDDPERAVRAALAIRDWIAQIRDTARARAAFIHVVAGKESRAPALLDEFLEDLDEESHFAFTAVELHALAWVALTLRRPEDILAIIDSEPFQSPWIQAARAVASNELRTAADILGAVEALPEEAFYRLRAAEQLVNEGRRAEADAQLRRALAFWRSVGATRYVREGEALLAASA